MSIKETALNKLQLKLLELKQENNERFPEEGQNVERLEDFIGLISDELLQSYEIIEQLKKQVR